MISETGLKVLKRMLDDCTRSWTIRELSQDMGLPYPQLHKNISVLVERKLISKEIKGKSSIIRLEMKSPAKEHHMAEVERKEDVMNKYKSIETLKNYIEKLRYNQFICILFGSHANYKAKKGSDIDLLFVIPDEYDYSKFEREVKTRILLPRLDIQITTENGLLEMWSTPSQLNIGNEILRKHIILYGTEAFLRLRKKHYFGEN